jgi:DNA-binding transcriptional LysR family regulator
MTQDQMYAAATEGAAVRIAVASNRGHKWVRGTIDRFRAVYPTVRVDIIGDDGVRYPNCSAMSVWAQ